MIDAVMVDAAGATVAPMEVDRWPAAASDAMEICV
jgi:hypothetical protein